MELHNETQLHQAISREADKIMFCIGTKVILEKTEKKSSKKIVILFKSKPLSCIFPQATTERSRISTDLARLHRFYFNYSWAKYTIEEWVVISSLFKYIFLYTLRERGWNTITHHNCESVETGITILPAVHKILPQPFQLSTHLPVPSHYCWTESLPWIVCLHTKIKIRKGMKVKVSGIKAI